MNKENWKTFGVVIIVLIMVSFFMGALYFSGKATTNKNISECKQSCHRFNLPYHAFIHKSYDQSCYCLKDELPFKIPIK